MSTEIVVSNQQTQTIEFNGANVRMVMVNGEPWFVAKDLVEAIHGAWKGTQTIEHIPAKHRGVTSVVTQSGEQQMVVFSEAGMNRYLSRSDLPAAQPWQDYICEVILPSIRKTGAYMAKPMSIEELCVMQSQALLDQRKRLDALETNHGSRLDSIEAALTVTDAPHQLPAPEAEVPSKTKRKLVYRLVTRSVRWHPGMGKDERKLAYRARWNEFYTEFVDTYSQNLKQRADNRAKETGTKCDPLDIAEEIGMIEQCYALALKLYGRQA